jgi:hypothetical protein
MILPVHVLEVDVLVVDVLELDVLGVLQIFQSSKQVFNTKLNLLRSSHS